MAVTSESGAEAERTRRAGFVLSLRSRGVLHTRTLKAIETIPRSLFAPSRHAAAAYADRALPIACGQSLESPLHVATVIDALGVGDLDVVLEIGTGTGYATAVLARLSRRVVSIDRWRTLVENAERRLATLGGCANATIVFGDGAAGRSEQGPFERILVSAAVLSPPSALFNQLKPGGVMIAPIGDARGQRLTRFLKGRDGALDETTIGSCRVQPLMAGTAKAL